MVGITAYGAYVPIWRLPRETIAKEWGLPAAPGEKAVANFDEDALTLGVAAAIDCLNGANRESIDGVLFASTTAPVPNSLLILESDYAIIGHGLRLE